MPVAGGGFDQCYNAQAAVAAGSLLVVATDVVQAANDKNRVEPMLEKIEALPEALGEVEHLPADTGYFSAGNVEACEKAGVEPVIAMGRQPHHPPLSERFEKAPDGIVRVNSILPSRAPGRAGAPLFLLTNSAALGRIRRRKSPILICLDTARRRML